MQQRIEIAGVISPEAYQLCLAYHMGTPLGEYTWIRYNIFPGTIIVGIGLFFLGLATAPPRPADWITMLLFRCLMLLVAVTALCFGTRHILKVLARRHLRFLLATEGFFYIQGSQIEAIWWQQVEKIWLRDNRTYLNGYGCSGRQYTIQLSTGQRYILDDNIDRINELGTRLIEEVNRRRFPSLLTALQAGYILYFEPYSISRAGISNGREVLLWQQVRAVKIKHDTITIEKEGQRFPWSTVATASIPNLQLFLMLLHNSAEDRLVG